jgi:hypothetical protein
MSRNSGKNAGKNTMIIIATVLTAVILLAVWAVLSTRNQNQRNQPAPTAGTTSPAASPTETVTAMPTETPTPATSTPSPTPTVSEQPDQGQDRRSTRKLDVPVKALYLNNESVRKNLDHYIKLANETEINAYVIDIKNDSGRLMYDSNIKAVNDAKADTPGFDIRTVTKKLHDNNIIVIARMVTFKDSTMTKYNPDLAIKTASGAVFNQHSMWLDASKKGSWDYIVSIAKEAVQFGFDEIQFDYIRFPETSLYKYQLDLEPGQTRSGAIEGFIRYARNSLPADTILSADVFGMPLISTKDYGEIGQTLETIGMSLDNICPMIYPSHFANNAKKGSMANGVGQRINGVLFTHPDLQPYEVVYNTLMVGKSRIEKKQGYNLKVRPYIQGFTADYLPDGYWKEYGVQAYQEQMKAVYDAGYTEWIFWNAPNDYVESAFKKK